MKVFIFTCFVIARNVFFSSVYLLILIFFLQDKAFFVSSMQVYLIVLASVSLLGAIICHTVFYWKKKANRSSNYASKSTIEKSKMISKVLCFWQKDGSE